MIDEHMTYDNKNHIWTGPKSITVFDKSTSIGLIALTMMRSQPSDRICQISITENTKLTFGEACESSIKVAQFLQDQGFNDEDVVGIVTTNTTYLMPILLGCWLNCTPFHVVSTMSDESTFRNIFSITKPKLIFCDGLYFKALKSALKSSQIKYFTLCNHLEDVSKIQDIFSTTIASPSYKPVQLKNGAYQTMAIFCTSGTTGQPKCVPFSNYRCLFYSNFVNGSSILYSTSAPSWGTALIIIIYGMLYGCQRIINNKETTIENLIDIIKKYNITYITITPMQMAQLTYQPNFVKSNLPKLKFVFIAGSACTTPTLKRFQKCLPSTHLIQAYGCTEFGLITHNLTIYEMGVLGKLMPDVQLKIVDPTTKKTLKHNENGEIFARWMHEKWLGYISNEVATQEILDDEGWLHTGDLGYMDDENTLHFVDRCKEILKYKGYQYSANDIENVINELKGVKDVCVFGVFSEEFGDLAAAAIVKVEGSDLTEAEVISYVAKRLILEQKCLNYGVFFVTEILRNTNGKVLRNKMRDICLQKSK